MTDLPIEGSSVILKLQTWAGEIEERGIILPSSSENHVTMKLPNGYNISHPTSSVISCKVLDNPPTAEDNSTEGKGTPQNSELPLVKIIHTGGTIASKVDYSTGAVVARFEPEELLASVPEIAEVAQIETVKLGNMWSDDIRPQHWNAMIDACSNAFKEGAVGVVITHGTDTLAVSASALAYGWSGNGGRPPGRIVLTGSQRSSDRGSSDAGENLLASVYWAANGPIPNGGLGDSTVVMMHANSDDGTIAVIPGCSARKLHSTRRDAFQAVNSENLANVFVSRDEINHELQTNYKNALSSAEQREIAKPTFFDSSVRIAQLIAGSHLHADMITAASDSGYSALVIHGTGLGHLPIENPNGDAPENEELEKCIKSVIANGMSVIIANQCIHGPVNMNVYSKGRQQQEIGILGQGANSSPEAVLVKTHWILSQGRNLEENLSLNLVGENPECIIS